MAKKIEYFDGYAICEVCNAGDPDCDLCDQQGDVPRKVKVIIDEEKGLYAIGYNDPGILYEKDRKMLEVRGLRELSPGHYPPNPEYVHFVQDLS